jgi:hypothetical protein
LVVFSVAGAGVVVQLSGKTMGMPRSMGTPPIGKLQVGVVPVAGSQLGSAGM